MVTNIHDPARIFVCIHPSTIHGNKQSRFAQLWVSHKIGAMAFLMRHFGPRYVIGHLSFTKKAVHFDGPIFVDRAICYENKIGNTQNKTRSDNGASAENTRRGNALVLFQMIFLFDKCMASIFGKKKAIRLHRPFSCGCLFVWSNIWFRPSEFQAIVWRTKRTDRIKKQIKYTKPGEHNRREWNVCVACIYCATGFGERTRNSEMFVVVFFFFFSFSNCFLLEKFQKMWNGKINKRLTIQWTTFGSDLVGGCWSLVAAWATHIHGPKFNGKRTNAVANEKWDNNNFVTHNIYVIFISIRCLSPARL